MIYDGAPGAFGSLIFAKFLATSVINANAGPDGECAGDHCFRVSHIVMVVVEIAAALLGCYLAFRTRIIYRALGLIPSGSVE